MCLTVDQISNGQDLIITGSKDHYIKVNHWYLLILAWHVSMGCRFQQKWLTSTHSKCDSQDENYFTTHGSRTIFSHNTYQFNAFFVSPRKMDAWLSPVKFFF